MPGSAVRSDTARLALIGIVGLTLLAYASALTAGFTADDFFVLSRLKEANGLGDVGAYFRAGFFAYYRPLAFVSHALDWTLWGAEPFGFHLTSILLHAGSTVLVWLIARRLFDGAAPAIAALLFGLHAASHEAVYWIAARFDLLATFFTLLALLCLNGRTIGGRVVGYIAFAFALLSKESAVSLLIIAPAWDVWVGRRDWRTTAARLLPLLVLTAAYVAVRTITTDVAVTGGTARAGKIAMLAIAIALVIAAAWWRDRGPNDAGLSSRTLLTAATFSLCVLIALLAMPATFAVVARLLGFAAYVTFHALTPVVQPGPSPVWFAPYTMFEAVAGLLAVTVIMFALIGWRRTIFSRPHLLFLLVFIAASLVPVSSMVGGLRYLYLASAGTALLAAGCLAQLHGTARRVGRVALTAFLVLSAAQILVIGRSWRWASTMTRDGVMLMSEAARPCGQKDVLLLTTPAGIGNVYGNFYYEAFDVLEGCSPRNFTTLLRVVRTDARVEVTSTANQVDIRLPAYAGNVVASADLRTFDHPIEPGTATTIETPAGRLVTFADGTTQVFRLTMRADAAAAAPFYYSAGRIFPVQSR